MVTQRIPTSLDLSSNLRVSINNISPLKRDEYRK